MLSRSVQVLAFSMRPFAGSSAVDWISKSWSVRSMRSCVATRFSGRHSASPMASRCSLLSLRVQLRIAVTDLRGRSERLREAELDSACAKEAQKDFDLLKGPLIRVSLLRTHDERYVMTLTAHQIVCDGWSIGVIIREAAKIYSSFIEGRASPLGEVAVQYPDYVIWQKENSSEYDGQLAFWRNKLRGYRPLRVPGDFPAPGVTTANGEIVSEMLARELTDALQQFSVRNGLTIFVTTLAAFGVLLRHYTGSDDIAVGSALAGRTRADLDASVGLFMNEIVLRTDASGDPQFTDFASRVRETVWEAVANQDVPFEQVVKAPNEEHSAGHGSMAPINFNCHRAYGAGGRVLGRCYFAQIPSKSPGTLYELNLFLIERAGNWRASLEYNTDLYRESTAEEMLRSFRTLLIQIAENPN